MKNYNEIKSLNQLAKNQKKLKEDKNDFIIEESKMASERDRKLSEEISDNSRRWKKIFTAKMNEQ